MKSMVIGFFAVMLVASAAPALAAPPLMDKGTHGYDGELSIWLETAPVQSSTVPSSRRATTSSPLAWASHRTWATMADGSNHGLCVGLRWVWGETQADADARASAGHDQFFNLYSNVLSIHLEDWDASLMCPEVEADPLPLVVVQDAVMELVRGQLPRPDLEIPPGRALTGLPAYLVTNHDLTYTGVHDLTIGPYSTTVDIQATGTTTVDWGDGTVETYSVPGTAYPDGQVSHVYAETGEVSVAATDRWVIEYTVTGPTTITNQMEAELETIAIDSLRVNQVQTVRVDR